jgi:ketosteroid isomerase-like protein
MSEENVEALKRGLEATNRRDVEALLEDLDPEVEWHPAFQALLGGEATVFRGHEGIREMLRDGYEVFGETYMEISEIWDLGDRVVATGSLRARGTESGAETESPIGYLVDFKNGKVTRVRGYLDHKEALKAAGLSE